ncbi:TPA: GntR family transcriptional regulator, partial [Pseudomonas aeruginosa]|nr:GntR family transcriptional regulator [Pseudomonas aeruginosa]
MQPDAFPASGATGDPELTMAENLQERLYQRLREDLLAGRFQPGERLKIRDLA